MLILRNNKFSTPASVTLVCHNGGSWRLSFNKIGTAVKTLKGFLKVAVKTVAHGLLGGNFWSDFAAGFTGAALTSWTNGEHFMTGLFTKKRI